MVGKGLTTIIAGFLFVSCEVSSTKIYSNREVAQSGQRACFGSKRSQVRILFSLQPVPLQESIVADDSRQDDRMVTRQTTH